MTEVTVGTGEDPARGQPSAEPEGHVACDEPPRADLGAASDADTFRFRSGAALEELEYEYIKHTLANNRNSSYADVAKLLGISKKTLWEKRKRYNLDEEVEEMTA